MSRIILLWGFLLIGYSAFCQNDSTSTATQADTTSQVPAPLVEEKAPFLRLDVGMDYLKLVSFAIPEERKWEGLAAINFNFGLSLDGEYGYTRRSPEHFYKNGSYSVEGTYYRIGFGYNYAIDVRNTIGIGVRYAKSEFEDFTSFAIVSTIPDWSNYNKEFKRSKIEAQWAEVVLKSEGRLNRVKNLKLGMFFRIKFIDPVKYEKREEFPLQVIPGYGLAVNKTSLAFNLFIKYSLPLF